jgi:hypothetical protein
LGFAGRSSAVSGKINKLTGGSRSLSRNTRKTWGKGRPFIASYSQRQGRAGCRSAPPITPQGAAVWPLWKLPHSSLLDLAGGAALRGFPRSFSQVLA